MKVSRLHARRARLGFAALLLSVGLALPGWVDAQTWQTPAVQMADAARVLEAELVRFDEIERQFQAELDAIEQFKQIDDPTALDARQLREALRAANATAESLAEADDRVRAAQSELRSAQEARLAEIDAERQRLEAAVGDNPSRIAQAVAAVNALSVERAALQEEMAVERTRVSLEDLLAYVPETPEEMLLAADELDDHVARLERELDELRADIQSAAIATRMADRDREFGREDDLLGGGSGRARPERTATPGRDEATADDGGGVVEESADETPLVGAPDADEPTADMGAPTSPDSAGAPPASGDDRENGDFGNDDGFGQGGFDGESGGGAGGGGELDPGVSNEDIVRFPGAVLDPEPTGPSADLVDSGGGIDSYDPTVLGEAPELGDGARGLAGASVEDLRALEMALQDRIGALRVERDRLRRVAGALD